MSDARTRRAILNLLKERGPTDSKSLAFTLKLTPMAIRLHLYELSKEKMVDFSEEVRPMGRPAKLWNLTNQANRIFPDAHAELSVSLIEAMNQTFGSEGLDQLLEVRKKKQLENYKQRLESYPTWKEKLKGLAELRTREGYMAEVKAQDQDFLLIENHCPICSAAQACVGFCRVELDIFKKVLGDEVCVERIEHLLGGARRCVYRVKLNSPAKLQKTSSSRSKQATSQKRKRERSNKSLT
ncbi:MAG: metalloregulator ArsR/SmtB family transcription factor [Verrucomicrobiota bacterium]